MTGFFYVNGGSKTSFNNDQPHKNGTKHSDRKMVEIQKKFGKNPTAPS